MEWTNDLLERLKEVELELDALNNGYYDTFDLNEIAKKEEDYKCFLNEHKGFLPDKDYGFWAYKLLNGEIYLAP